MAQINVLDKNATLTLMEEGDLNPQSLYNLDVSAITFGDTSKLRLTVNLLRTNTTPEECTVISEGCQSALVEREIEGNNDVLVRDLYVVSSYEAVSDLTTIQSDDRAQEIVALDITVYSQNEEECDLAGVSYTQMSRPSTGGIAISPAHRYTEGMFIYGGAIEGTPISGIGLRIDEAMTDLEHFTGWIILVNEVEQKVQLVYLLDQSIYDPVPGAQVVAESATMPAAGDFVWWDADFESTGVIHVYDNDFNMIINYTTASQISYCFENDSRVAMNNAGFVWGFMAGESGTHSARWYQEGGNAYLTTDM